MKKLLYSTMMVGALAFGITSCTKTCEPGYEGSDCKTEVRAKVIGTYGVNENCTPSGNASYDITFSKSSADVMNVLITPFGGYPGTTGTAKIDGETITIDAQSSNGWDFNGTGTVSSDGGTITLSYTITDSSGGSDACTGTGTKK